MTQRSACCLMAVAMVAGCSGVVDSLDCSGIGTVRGRYDDVNIGRIELRYGAAWGSADAGYTVVLADHPGYAEALQRSAHPLSDSERAAELLGLVVLGADYSPAGDFVAYFAWGEGSSRGTGGEYRGDLRVDEKGCARGEVKLYGDNRAVFALPLWRPDNAQLYAQGPEDAHAPFAVTGGVAPPGSDDPLQAWAAVHAQLMHPHPGEALLALGLSVPVAEHLANDPSALATLERLRTQCPDPARATLNEYSEVEGPSSPAPDITLSGWVSTELDAGGLRLRQCSVNERNGQSVEQCWPLKKDCRRAPLWRPDN